MGGSADLWVLTATYLVCWYALGAVSLAANFGDARHHLRQMFFGHRDQDGLPWWGVALMISVIGMTVAASLVMILAMEPI